eukprot:15805998-Heterocapsa_arctica.AAC.1
MVAVPQVGNLPQPCGGKTLRSPRSQAQLFAQMPMGMWTFASAAKRGLAPAHLGHGPCTRGTGLWDYCLHGWVRGFPQRPPHA